MSKYRLESGAELIQETKFGSACGAKIEQQPTSPLQQLQSQYTTP